LVGVLVLAAAAGTYGFLNVDGFRTFVEDITKAAQRFLAADTDESGGLSADQKEKPSTYLENQNRTVEVPVGTDHNGFGDKISMNELPVVENRIHNLINEERKAKGLPALSNDDRLAAVARAHSIDMAQYDYFAHDNLKGQGPSGRAELAGYICRKDYGTHYTEGIAENIFQTWLYSSTTNFYLVIPVRDYMSSEELTVQVVDGWMASPGHRDNILDGDYDREGIGIAVSKDEKVYITQNFC
jgi:uncharacterized protein YkwD